MSAHTIYGAALAFVTDHHFCTHLIVFNRRARRLNSTVPRDLWLTRYGVPIPVSHFGKAIGWRLKELSQLGTVLPFTKLACSLPAS
jgi:hypothetical protein